MRIPVAEDNPVIAPGPDYLTKPIDGRELDAAIKPAQQGRNA
jgi:DNA-binding response OmpR family regulator